MVVNFDVLVHQQHLKETKIVNCLPKNGVWASDIFTSKLRNYYKGVLSMRKVEVEGMDDGPINRSRG